METRRDFLKAAGVLMTAPVVAERAFAEPVMAVDAKVDSERMKSLVAFTMLTMETPSPVPFGAEIFDTKTGESLMRAVNQVGPEHDPSAHGEIWTIRLACKKRQNGSLKGFTLYTTCEPCPMCMACCLWCGLDRVVYGATIADAGKYGHQIYIPAAEVEKRGDMPCVVTGPVEEGECLKLFTHPKMQEMFKRWKS